MRNRNLGKKRAARDQPAPKGRPPKLLGHAFKNANLHDLALSHSSWASEAGMPGRHNERLEFLGDAVLEVCVSAELYGRFPDAREGQLTSMRSQLVNASSLAALARATGINQLLKLGVGETRQGGRDRDSILSDALEAALGAIFLDGGFMAAQKVVKRIFATRWPGVAAATPRLDNKSWLQQLCLRLFQEFPAYSLVRACGPEHAKIFEVCLCLPDGRKFLASNSSRKKAEQDAAACALAALNAVP